MTLKRVIIKVVLYLLGSSSLGALETLSPGALTVAVTGIVTDERPGHGSWVYRILSEFAKEHDLDLRFVVVDFDSSWELPALDRVDLAATGLAPLPSRLQEGVSASLVYCRVQRGLRIHARDAHRFHTIQDFVGHRIAVISGMTAELDLDRRASEGVEIVRVDTWEELYDLFYRRKVDAIAEGYYMLPGFEEINQLDRRHPMIDNHDLYPGLIEGNTFFVRDRSDGLLDAINAFIQEKGLPFRRLH